MGVFRSVTTDIILKFDTVGLKAESRSTKQTG